MYKNCIDYVIYVNQRYNSPDSYYENISICKIHEYRKYPNSVINNYIQKLNLIYRDKIIYDFSIWKKFIIINYDYCAFLLTNYFSLTELNYICGI